LQQSIDVAPKAVLNKRDVLFSQGEQYSRTKSGAVHYL
jgi:hypothetical protein